MAGRYSPAQIAQVCHEANRGLHLIQPDDGIPVADSWDDLAEGERAEVTADVEHALAGATVDELHEQWCNTRYTEGWTHGPTRDADLRTHPYLVPYDDLPAAQHEEYELFAAVVDTLADDRPVEFVTDGRDPETVELTAHFAYTHLPDDLAAIARACAASAALMFNHLPDGPELRSGLQSLRLAKNAFVSAAAVRRD